MESLLRKALENKGECSFGVIVYPQNKKKKPITQEFSFKIFDENDRKTTSLGTILNYLVFELSKTSDAATFNYRWSESEEEECKTK